MMPPNARLHLHLRPHAQVAFVLFLIPFCVALFEPLQRLFNAMSTPENNYGFLLVLLALYVFGRRLPSLLRMQSSPEWRGLGFVALGILVATVSELGYFIKLFHVAFVLILFGFTLTYFGRNALPLLRAPFAVLLLAAPIPDYFTIQTSIVFQLISSALGTEFLKLFGIAVYRDGNIIDLGNWQLQVAEACSGLRYLLPLLVTAICLVWLVRAPFWAKIITIVSVLPLTIGLNSFRIAMTGILFQVYGRGAADGLMHLFEGWLIFLVGLVLLFVVLFGVTWLHGGVGHPLSLFDFDRIEGEMLATAVAPPVRPQLSVLAPPMLIGLVLVLGFTIATPLLRLRDPVIPERPSFLTFPLSVGDYTGIPLYLDEQVRAQLKATAHLLVNYEDTGGNAVNFWIAYNDKQTAQRMLHSPKGCLPAGGWEYEWLNQQNIDVAGIDEDQNFRVSEAIAVRGNARVAMVYWMEARGRRLASEVWNKFFNFYDAVTLRRTDGALVRVVSAVERSESDEEALARVYAFIDDVYVHLIPYVSR